MRFCKGIAFLFILSLFFTEDAQGKTRWRKDRDILERDIKKYKVAASQMKAKKKEIEDYVKEIDELYKKMTNEKSTLGSVDISS